jgi:hypothetical protein
MKKQGFKKSIAGVETFNHPYKTVWTGNWKLDFYGYWYEFITNGNKKSWMVGDPPNRN